MFYNLGPEVSTRSRSRKERRKRYRELSATEKLERRKLRKEWIDKGRLGHAPRCNRSWKGFDRHLTGSGLLSRYPNRYNHIRYYHDPYSICSGCGGIVEPK